MVELGIIMGGCQPIEANWESTLGDSQCLSARFFDIFLISAATYNVTSDVGVALIPIFLLWNIQMKLRLKILTNMVLGLGIVFVLNPYHYILITIEKKMLIKFLIGPQL
jgi:hypothetical protein